MLSYSQQPSLVPDIVWNAKEIEVIIPLSVDIYLGYLYPEAIVNNTAMDMNGQIFV